MSKANPFDQEMSPRKRLVSNLFFILTTLLVVAFILWVLVSQPGKVRSRFDYTAGGFHTVGQNRIAGLPADEAMAADEELYRLCFRLQAEPMAWNADFQQAYPAAAALLQPEDGVFEARKPKVSEGAACVSLALCSVDGRARDIRRLDVLTVPFASGTDGAKQAVTLFAPRAFTVVYNTQTGVIQLEEVRADNFRLYCYNLALTLRGTDGWSNPGYQLSLNGVVSDKEADQGDLFGRIEARPDLFGPARLSRQDDCSLLTGRGEGAAGVEDITLTLHFNDFMYDAFSSLRLEAEGSAQAASFQLAFNEET